jgi:hypothetical protein
MNLKHALFPLFCSLFALVSTGCINTHFQKLHTTASEAPEVHGGNTSLQPHSASWRVTGKISSATRKDVEITPEVSKSRDKSKEGVEADWLYKMGGVEFTGKADFLYKANGPILGTGVGYNNGIYHHFLFGANFSHVEYGLFIGLYHHYSDVEYEGEHCELFIFSDDKCDSFSNESHGLYTTVFGGGFAGLILGDFFLNYSLSIYVPSPTIEDSSPGLSGIYSNYFTMGYRFHFVELSAGLVATFIDEGFVNYGFTGGLTFYLN